MNGCLLNSCGAPLSVLYSEAPEVPGDCAAIVDALYGTGLSRELDGAALSAVRRINESGLPVVSVDIPSGVDGATGQVLGDAVRARETVAFHRAKHGLLLYPGRAYAGKLTVADIRILPEWDGAQGIDVLEEADACALLPRSPADGHKGHVRPCAQRGRERGMAGAAALCARSALRAGRGAGDGGLPVRGAGYGAGAGAPARRRRWLPTARRSTRGRRICSPSWPGSKAALAIGPGLGREEGAWLAIEALVRKRHPEGSWTRTRCICWPNTAAAWAQTRC
ncbi:MAG: NAD(P)H-hydrate epimerase [Christensenellales bacterium]